MSPVAGGVCILKTHTKDPTGFRDKASLPFGEARLALSVFWLPRHFVPADSSQEEPETDLNQDAMRFCDIKCKCYKSQRPGRSLAAVLGAGSVFYPSSVCSGHPLQAAEGSAPGATTDAGEGKAWCSCLRPRRGPCSPGGTDSSGRSTAGPEGTRLWRKTGLDAVPAPLFKCMSYVAWDLRSFHICNPIK